MVPCNSIQLGLMVALDCLSLGLSPRLGLILRLAYGYIFNLYPLAPWYAECDTSPESYTQMVFIFNFQGASLVCAPSGRPVGIRCGHVVDTCALLLRLLATRFPMRHHGVACRSNCHQGTTGAPLLSTPRAELKIYYVNF